MSTAGGVAVSVSPPWSYSLTSSCFTQREDPVSEGVAGPVCRLVRSERGTEDVGRPELRLSGASLVQTARRRMTMCGEGGRMT